MERKAAKQGVQKNMFPGRMAGCAVVLLLLNLFYFLLITVTFMLPVQDRVERNVAESLHEWRGGYETEAPVFEDNRVLWDDISSEMIMVNVVVTQEGRPLEQGTAFYFRAFPETGEIPPVQQYRNLEAAVLDPQNPELALKSYERYWYLELGFLRMLFTFLTMREIRWLLYNIGTLLVLWLVCRVYRISGARGLVPLALAFMSRVLMLNMASFITAMDVYVACASMIAVTYLYNRPRFTERQLTYYLILGSVTFAIGPLIAPVLTLGMTLVMQIVLCGEKDRDRSAWFRLFANSAAWAFGYVLTMLIKAAVSAVVVRNAEGFSVAADYMSAGSGDSVSERIARIFSCIERLLLPLQPSVVVALVMGAVFVFFIIRCGVKKNEALLLEVAVACYPVLWVFAVSGHSKHDYAVNIFAVSVYGLASACAGFIGNRKAA